MWRGPRGHVGPEARLEGLQICPPVCDCERESYCVREHGLCEAVAVRPHHCTLMPLRWEDSVPMDVPLRGGTSLP